jgi:hypothetical protein
MSDFEKEREALIAAIKTFAWKEKDLRSMRQMPDQIAKADTLAAHIETLQEPCSPAPHPHRRLFSRFTYEEKLSLMMLPIDYPVTRLMLVKTKKKYLDKVYEHFTGVGFTLTDPKRFGVAA